MFDELTEAIPDHIAATPHGRVGQFIDYMAGALECDGVQADGHTDGHLVTSIEVTEQLLHDLWAVWEKAK